jgi:hypothetical protein
MDANGEVTEATHVVKDTAESHSAGAFSNIKLKVL